MSHNPEFMLGTYKGAKCICGCDIKLAKDDKCVRCSTKRELYKQPVSDVPPDPKFTARRRAAEARKELKQIENEIAGFGL